ncbi:MAG: ParB N-terminal domain-containing protein [Erysipelotrichaceae bacterium]|nr:ParB N-terminal domain-containing protein [Erysipelotrichaceae bacterium]
MEENITRGLFNPDSLTEAAKGKIKAIDTYLIKENRLNEIYSQDDIECLKENIKEFQLSQPLVVRKNPDGSYTIISGHRRFKACKAIFEEGAALYYFDKEFVNQIPCVIDSKIYRNEDDEFLAIVSSNAARVLSSDERKAIYLKLKEIYDRKCAAGEKPKGRERETIAAWMGVTDRTVQNYKKQTEGDHVQRQNNSGKILKKISGIEHYFTDLKTDIYTDEELEHLRQSAIPAINILMMRLNIDIRDL